MNSPTALTSAFRLEQLTGHTTVATEDLTIVLFAFDDRTNGKVTEGSVEGLVVELGQGRLGDVRVEEDVRADGLKAVLAIHLEHLMVSAQQNKALRFSQFEGKEKAEDLYRLRATVDVITYNNNKECYSNL